MHHSRTWRIIGIGAGVCLLLVLSCGLLGLALQRGAITLADIDVDLGPLSMIVHAPRPSVCPQLEKADPLTNLCDRFSSIHGPSAYRILLFWRSERGALSSRVLGMWTVPVHQERSP